MNALDGKIFCTVCSQYVNEGEACSDPDCPVLDTDGKISPDDDGYDWVRGYSGPEPLRFDTVESGLKDWDYIGEDLAAEYNPDPNDSDPYNGLTGFDYGRDPDSEDC